MSNSKRILCLTLVMAALTVLLSGCGQSASVGQAMLMKPGQSSEAVYKTAQVALGDVFRISSAAAYVTYPDYTVVRCQEDGAIFVSFHIADGAQVKEGDPIASFRFEYSDATLYEMETNLKIMREQYDYNKKQYYSQVTAAQETLDLLSAQEAPNSYDLTAAQINLKKIRATYNNYVSSQKKAIESSEQAIEDYSVAQYTVYAPRDGVVQNLQNLFEDTVLNSSDVICELHSTDIVWLYTSESTGDVMRYGCDVDITVSKVDETFSARVVTSPDANGGVALIQPDKVFDDSYSGDTLVAEESGGRWNRTTVTRTSRISVLGYSHYLTGVPVIPNSAIYNEDSDLFVYLYEDGMAKKRYISTGLSSSTQTQVLSGLELGELVILP